MLTLFFQRNDLHRNMARGWVELELIENRPAKHVGQKDIERDSRRAVLPGERQAHHAFGGNNALESFVASQPKQNARIMRVVLHDQQHRITFADVVAVVFDVFFAARLVEP